MTFGRGQLMTLTLKTHITSLIQKFCVSTVFQDTGYKSVKIHFYIFPLKIIWSKCDHAIK